MPSPANHPAAGPFTSRSYEREADLRAMQDLLVEARSLTDDWRYAHIGELAWSFFMVACHLRPLDAVRLWHGSAGKLIAYAVVGEDPSFDCQVHPQYERSGIETEALGWAQALVDGFRRRDARRWGGPLVAGARKDDTRRIVFLEEHGFRYRGEFSEVNMMRSLAGTIPPPAPPAGWQVRPLAGSKEVAERAAAHRQVWQPWTVGNVRADDYAALRRLPGYDSTLDLVAVGPDGVIGAYANGWLDPLNRVGDLGPVGARPAYRRQGLARSVLLAAMCRMREAGMDRVCVSTGTATMPARQLYESLGFKIQNLYLDYAK